MQLADLIHKLIAHMPTGGRWPTAMITAVRDDSRAVQLGDLFVAVRGRNVDGHHFLQKAAEQGAVAAVVEAVDSSVPIPQIVVSDSAQALGILVGAMHGSPADAMIMIGITGTNGKTTTTYLMESIIAAAGGKPGIIGTVSYRWAGKTVDAPYTTPTPDVLHATLAAMRSDGCTHVIMETSSVSFSMQRLAGIKFTVGAFSNLTQDHLDVHGSMDEYRDAKRMLFTQHLRSQGTAVVNVDDPAGSFMVSGLNARVLRVSSQQSVVTTSNEIQVVQCESSVGGIAADIKTPRGVVTMTSRPLVGAYNIANVALAVGIAEALGLPHDAIARGVQQLPGVPGRVERVVNDQHLDVLVDYAHTPDALINVLQALRPLTKRRLICVFGCGGDRDPSKRLKMGAAVAEYADLAVVTSDNPRTEAPQSIIDAILPAVPSPFFVSVDRAAAIAAAVSEATPGDIVLIAGKGHEDYQIIGTTKIHFDDREQATQAIAQRPQFQLGEVAAWLGVGCLSPATVASRVVIDSRQVTQGDLYVAVVGERLNGNDFVAAAMNAGAAAAIVASADAARVMAALTTEQQTRVLVHDDPRAALGTIASEHRRRWSAGTVKKLIAITGSAGKTTTKELTRAALSAAGITHAAMGSLNNETGVPLTMLGLRAHHQYAVLEMGMRGAGQIEYLTMMAQPDVGVVVNAGSAHIELLGGTDAIAAAKAEMWKGLNGNGVVVRPADDDRLATWAKTNAPTCKQMTFGESAASDVRLSSYQVSRASAPAGSELELQTDGRTLAGTSPMLGRHAAVDAVCAVAAAMAAGVPATVALAGIAHAKNAGMRGEVVDVAGRHVIVDCYNANPASMQAALQMLAELSSSSGNPGVAVVGDMLELGDFASQAHIDVGSLAATLSISVIALGQWRQQVLQHASKSIATANDPEAAAVAVMAATRPGHWILLKASRGMRLERVLVAMQNMQAGSELSNIGQPHSLLTPPISPVTERG